MPHIILFFVTSILGLAFSTRALAIDAAALERGRYIFHASGGCSCHINQKSGDASLAGGRAMKTPFGTFYSTNITSDRETGIGKWSLDDFYNAMTRGIRPDGSNLYPTFPYTSFAKMTRTDVMDLGTYVFSLPPVKRENRKPDAPLPMTWRWTITPWKWLFFNRDPFVVDGRQSEKWNRGAYLVTAVSHCAECHSPRNLMGAVKKDLVYAGAKEGPEGDPVPNMTSHPDGIGEWSDSELKDYLKTGMTPDGDFAGDLMGEVIDQGYKYLSDSDLDAIVEYVRSLPKKPSVFKKEKKKEDPSEF